MNTKGLAIGGKTYYTICVHDHRFHSDDVFAVALLEQIFLQFELQMEEGVQHIAKLAGSMNTAVLPHQLPIPVIRLSSNRDPEFFRKLEETDVLCVDVGMGEFDHHQLNAKRHANGDAYCGLSLLWEQILADNCYITGGMREFTSILENDIIYPIEAADNGRRPFALSHLIEFRNAKSAQNSDTAFVEAVRIAMKILGPFVAQMKRDEMELKECLANSKKLQTMALASNRIAIADRSYRPRVVSAAFPWAQMVLYPDYRNGKFTFALRSIDDVSSDGVNHNRWLVPEEFRDKTKWEELLGVQGIPEPIFVHPNGFLATFSSLSTVAEALMNPKFICPTEWGAAREGQPEMHIPSIEPLHTKRKDVDSNAEPGLATRMDLEAILKKQNG